MGLFNNLKDAVKKTVDEKVDETRTKMGESAVGRMTLGAIDAAKGTSSQVYRLPAEHEATVYTYDGNPLKGIPTGERFVIEAVPGRVTMTSKYTGITTSTDDFDNVAYSYKGKVFGMASSHSPAIKKLMKHGYRVEVEAYIRGYDGTRGFPYVVGLFGFVDDSVYRNVK